MAKTQQEIQEILVHKSNIKNVYFQPPENIKLTYPAIIYSLNNISQIHADNKKYINNKEYKVVIIDKNPNSIIYEKLLELPHSSFTTNYVSDNLNHYVLNIYF